MDIFINEDLKELLKRSKKFVLSIYKEEALGCWGSQFEILVRINFPKIEVDYTEFVVDEFRIFLSNDLLTNEKMYLDINKIPSDMPNREIKVTFIN